MITETEPVFESTDGMHPTCALGLRNLLLACADTKLLLGYHFGEWTFGPPELEAAVANCSMAQSELGHVRLLHALLKKHFGDDPDELVEQRPASAFANISYLDSALKDWPSVVATNYVVDLAVTRMFYSMRGSSFKPLRMSLEKVLDEERHHAHHGQGWFKALATKNATTRTAMTRAVNDALRAVCIWFGPEHEAEDAALVASGIKSQSNVESFQELTTDIVGLATELKIPLEKIDPPIGSAWNPATRRSQGNGPDDDILYHLRGGKNAVFKSS